MWRAGTGGCLGGQLASASPAEQPSSAVSKNVSHAETLKGECEVSARLIERSSRLWNDHHDTQNCRVRPALSSIRPGQHRTAA
jgi:hypothetical protein